MIKTGLKILFVLGLFLLAPIPSTAVANPNLSVDASTAFVNSPLQVTGSGFEKFSKVVILWHDGHESEILVAKTWTDEDGTFAADFHIPNSVGGHHAIFAIEELDLAAETAVTVQPKIERLSALGMNSPNILPGAILRLEGSGGFNGLVLTIDNRPVFAEPKITTDGSFSYEFVAVDVPGAHFLALYDVDGRISSTASFTVNASSIDPLTPGHQKLADDLSSLFSKLSAISRSNDENTSLLRQDFLDVRKDLGVASKLSTSESEDVKKDIKTSQDTVLSEVRASTQKVVALEVENEQVQQDLSAIQSQVSEANGGLKTLGEELNKSTASIREEVRMTEEKISSRINGIDYTLGQLSSGVASSRTAIEERLLGIQNTMTESAVLIDVLVLVGIAFSAVIGFQIRRRK